MKPYRRDLYIIAGLGMIVGSFFAAAKAIGGLIALVYFLASTNFTETYPSISDNAINTWKATMMSGMVNSLGTFLILFFGGRWMIRGPKFLDRWIDRGDKLQAETTSGHTSDEPQE